MATELEDSPRTDHEAEAEHPHDEGGPVKSFLDHLEDLRWVLIKTIAVIGIGMLLCLIAGDQVVKLLKWPLTRAKVQYAGTNVVATVYLGTNILGTYQLNEELSGITSPTNGSRFQSFQLGMRPDGTNGLLLTLKPDPAANSEEARRLRVNLQNFGPVGGFFVALQVALYGGLVLAAPFVFYFIAGFIFPALKLKEKHYVYRGLGFGLFLFALGVCFCYFILLPLALSASVAYSNWLGFGASQWRAEEYISFVCKFMLGMGIGFKMPVVLLTLVKIGVLNYKRLAAMRRYMIVVNLVLGALLTTPEVLTQVMMAIPLQFLYEASVWVAYYWERGDRKRAKAEAKASGGH